MIQSTTESCVTSIKIQYNRIENHKFKELHKSFILLNANQFFSKQCHRALHGSRRSLVADEVRRVQSRHRRVLGELNLSVEAMLMPAAVDNNEEEIAREPHETSTEELLPLASFADDVLSRGYDMDSGFSGSSSASYRYIGKLRYYHYTYIHLL